MLNVIYSYIMSQISLGNDLHSVPLLEMYRSHCLFTLQCKAANLTSLMLCF